MAEELLQRVGLWVGKWSDIIWGPPLVIMLAFVGLLYTFRSGFFQIRCFGEIFSRTVGCLFRRGEKRAAVPAFQAMATALGGTIGIGNIAGVATALTAGGPGAIFWMWVSGLCGMMTKFAEVCLAVHYRRIDKNGNPYGGPMYYIRDALGRKFAPLAVLFAVLCVLASFGIGNLTQTNAVAMAVEDSFQFPRFLTGLFMAALIAVVIGGGFQRISHFTGIFVPLMSVGYLLISFYVILVNRRFVPEAITEIFTGAFGFRPAAGGAAGFAVSAAVRVGVSRGIFTNEAGMGSSPIAHASAKGADPVVQGMWGALEVFIDTIVVCTVTALVILCSGTYQSGTHLGGALLTQAAFSEVLGRFGGQFIALSMALFAFASIVGWAYYGQSALRFLTGGNRRAGRIYRFLFFIALIAGSVADLDLVWSLSDLLNGLMALPNILALTLLYPVVIEQLKLYRIKNPRRDSQVCEPRGTEDET